MATIGVQRKWSGAPRRVRDGDRRRRQLSADGGRYLSVSAADRARHTTPPAPLRCTADGTGRQNEESCEKVSWAEVN